MRKELVLTHFGELLRKSLGRLKARHRLKHGQGIGVIKVINMGPYSTMIALPKSFI